MGSEALAQALYQLTHCIDREAGGGQVDRLLGEVECRQLEQAVAVVDDDVLYGRLGELAGDLPQLLLARLIVAGVPQSARRRRPGGRRTCRGARTRARATPGGGAGVVGAGDLVLTVGCPEAAHGC